MKYLYLTCILIFSIKSFSQKSSLPLNYAGLSAGRSFHGSGDLRGVMFSTEFAHYFKKKLSWTAELSGTIHDGSFPEFFMYNGQEIDGSVRFTVAGVQLAGHLGFSVVRNKENDLQLRLGILCRYQSSSLPYDVTTLYPAITNLPFPVIIFNNVGPLRTFVPGAGIQIRYAYTFNNKIAIGIFGDFQADTEGDNISQISLSAGFRF